MKGEALKEIARTVVENSPMYLELREEEIRIVLEVERERALKRYKELVREGHFRELWSKYNPLARGIRKWLRENNHDLIKLHNLCVEIHSQEIDRMYKRRKMRTAGNIPPNWINTDPVLKFVLENKIPDGLQRNRVLFKNLAVGLVYSGLSEVEIKEYAERIAGNCPGKTPQEILGWVSRIQRDIQNGRDWEYNRAEMNKWIDKANVVIHGRKDS